MIYPFLRHCAVVELIAVELASSKQDIAKMSLKTILLSPRRPRPCFCGLRITCFQPLALLPAVLVLTGCAHLGPHSIPVDRFDYSTAVAESWKQQTLLNIVKLRYLDLPVFMDVAQIVSGYQLATSVGVNGTLSSEAAVQGNFVSMGGTAQYIDRPTITYVPMTGDKFLRGLMEPIPPHSVFYMIQSGLAADFVMGLAVEAINGLRNRSASIATQRPADRDFLRVVQLMRSIQLSDAVGIRVDKSTNSQPSTVLFFRKDELEPEIEKQIDELKRLLRVEPGESRFRLVYSPVRSSAGELGVQTRSMMQILLSLASFVDVPPEHIKEQRVIPSIDVPSDQWPIRVKFSNLKPKDAYAEISYRGGWYWIDDRDIKSKRAFGFIMFLFTLADTGPGEPLPLITIPAQ